jgi:hypothetical protein
MLQRSSTETCLGAFRGETEIVEGVIEQHQRVRSERREEWEAIGHAV